MSADSKTSLALASASQLVVEFEGVGRTYPGPPPVEALRPADLTLREGEWVAITGPSGSGKSTILNLIGLLDHPTSGSYRLDGRDVSDLSDRARTDARCAAIGFVFQSFYLIGHLTAVRNVEIGLLYQSTRRRERQTRSIAALHRVGLGHRCDALPTTMSGGERQRVGIARALVREPRVLLCDEPTGNLDSHNAGQVLDLLDELRDRRLTIVVVTHDPSVAARADRTIEMLDGIATSAAPNREPR